MVAIKNIALFIASVAAVAIPRDTAKLTSDLSTIDKDVKALTSAANSWSGSIFTAGAIQSGANQLESDLKTAGSDAASNGAVSAADATTLVNYINSPLQSDIAAAMAALKAKQSNIDNDGLKSTVHDAIQSIKQETDTYAANLKAIFPSAQQSSLAQAMSTIDSELQSGIDEFS